MSKLFNQKLSRRDFLKASAATAGASLLAACAPPAAPAPAAAPTEKPTAEVKPAEQPPALKDVPRNKTVIFDIDGGRVIAPDLWNPFVPGSRRDQGFHQAMIEPLFVLNYGGTRDIEPWLGVSMTSNDTMDVWTLKLREGIEWSDGAPYTADDIVFTIQMLIDHAPDLADSAAMKEWVAKVEKVDDLTVKFTLTKPNPRFQLDYLTVKIWGSVTIVPKHIWESQDPLTFRNYDPAKGWPVFTGPYKIIKVSETEFIYDRDDNWWGARSGWKPLPQPERLIWIWAGPEETRAALMADHNLDSLMDITLGAFLALQQRNPNVIAWYKDLPYTWPDPCPRNIEINTAIEPWNDKEMRWALNYAINREQVAQIAYEGTSKPSRLFFPPYEPLLRYEKLLEDAGLYEKYPIDKHDPEKARQIIESRGWTMGSDGYYQKDGKQLVVTVGVPEPWVEIQRNGQVVVEQLQAIGINATMRTLAVGPFFDDLAFGKFELVSGWFTCGSVTEPWASMDTFNAKHLKPVGERASTNWWRWKNEEYSKLVDEIGSLPLNDLKVDELFVKAMAIWLDELPTIPLTKSKKLIPFDTTYWTNWPTADNNYMVAPTWLQNTHKIIHNLQPTGK